jgi:myo-inositol-1-phosphate synthase
MGNPETLEILGTGRKKSKKYNKSQKIKKMCNMDSTKAKTRDEPRCSRMVSSSCFINYPKKVTNTI